MKLQIRRPPSPTCTVCGHKKRRLKDYMMPSGYAYHCINKKCTHNDWVIPQSH